MEKVNTVQVNWNLPKKISFRFAFIYFVLFIFLLDWYGLNLTAIIFDIEIKEFRLMRNKINVITEVPRLY